MANIFKQPTYQAKIPYNGFNMDNLLKFSSTVGELLPVYYDVLQPGDKVSCGIELKTRTQPMTSAAMCYLNEHIEWFFVPIKQLYSLFGAFYFNVDDLESSVYDNQQAESDIPFVPALNLPTYLTALGSTTDTYFPTLKGTSYRLFELLGVPWETIVTNSSNVSMGLCPLLGCAYQKIYYDYYRNTEREENRPIAYNLDKYYNAPTTITQSDFEKMYQLHYRRWKPDFFMNVLPSPLFGDEGIGSMGYSGAQSYARQLQSSFQQWLVGTTVSSYNSTLSTSNVPATLPDVGQDYREPTVVSQDVNAAGLGSPSLYIASANSVRAALSPTAIRTSFAVQKLLEVTRRAGKHYDAQQLAHFGVKMPKGIDGEVYFLGSQDSVINIGDVIATAAGASNNTGMYNPQTNVFGQVSGKGYGYGRGGKVSFEAPCHGILMAIYSCEPNADYDDEGFDKLNHLMYRDAWFTEQFDNLGPQPLFRYQINYAADPSVDPNIFGWQWRYSELKCKYNRITGSLKKSLGFWTPSRYSITSNNLRTFLINPTYVNPIFLAAYDFQPDMTNLDFSSLFERDPFFHELYFDVKKSSKMSTYGLESL